MNRIGKESRKLFVLLTLFASSMCTDKAVANDYFSQDCYACDQNEGKFFLRGDVLYWKPHISGLELDFGTGSIAQTTVGATQVIVSDEYDTDPHYNWDTGYRIAGGYGMANYFGLGLEYTHFQGNGHRRSFDNGDITSEGKFNVKLNQIDLVIGYDYAFNCDFNLKPFIGVRGTRIKDSVKGLITTQLTIDGDISGGEVRFFNHKQDYRAVGPQLGIQGDYTICGGLGLYGTAAASLLYGKYRVNFDDATFLVTLVDSTILSSNRRHVHSFDPNVDLALGVFWKTDFFECAEVNMKLGFEHHEYFNQNHLSVYRGDMSFSGGIFAIEIAL